MLLTPTLTPTTTAARRWRVSRTNWASLRWERRRPEVVLLSRRRGGGGLPVVRPCWRLPGTVSHWLTFPPPRHTPPPSSHPPAAGFRASGVRSQVKQRHSCVHAAGVDVADELTLATVQARRQARALTSALSPCSRFTRKDRRRAATAHSLYANKG